MPKCAEVPGFLNDVTEFIPCKATCGLCLLCWHLEHSGSSGYMKKPKKPKMSAIAFWRFADFNGCEQIPLPHVPRVSKALISTTAQGLSAEVFCKVLSHLSCQFPLEKWKNILSYQILSHFKRSNPEIVRADGKVLIPRLSHFLQIKAEDLFDANGTPILVLSIVVIVTSQYVRYIVTSLHRFHSQTHRH